MAKMPPPAAPFRNSLRFHKPKEHFQPRRLRAKGMSFLAFILSVVVFYSSIFYIFNISPSHNLRNSKFWWFISNTLVLIIAVDYGAFSSSSAKETQDIYEEYATMSRLHAKINNASGFVAENPEVIARQSPEVTVNESDPAAEEVEDKINESEREAKPEEPQRQSDGKREEEEEKEKMPCAEEESSTSETNEETKEIIVYETVSAGDKIDPGGETQEVNEDEFSKMSDEELNKRVEEFITKLRRQIQLQGVRDLS